MIPIYVLTNRKHHWLLPGFAYLFNQYWSPKQKVTVVSYGRNDLRLPANFGFHAIAPQNYPAEKWSDGIIRFLAQIDDDVFITFLEDFWLNAPVDIRAVENLYAWMRQTRGTLTEVLRIDLWGTVKSKKQTKDWGRIRDIPIVYTPPGTKYQMALQCNIWNRAQLMRVLVPGENPWKVEINGSKRVSEKELNVLGVLNPVVHYEPIFQKGSIDHERMQKIPEINRGHIAKMGWLKR